MMSESSVAVIIKSLSSNNCHGYGISGEMRLKN